MRSRARPFRVRDFFCLTKWRKTPGVPSLSEGVMVIVLPPLIRAPFSACEPPDNFVSFFLKTSAPY